MSTVYVDENKSMEIKDSKGNGVLKVSAGLGADGNADTKAKYVYGIRVGLSLIHISSDVSGGRGPVRNKPLRLASGRILAGASTEHGIWKAFADISDDDGASWHKSSAVQLSLIHIWKKMRSVFSSTVLPKLLPMKKHSRERPMPSTIWCRSSTLILKTMARQ